MKQTPQEKKIQENMQPGVITLTGFLGNDTRHLHDIIAEDRNTIERLGISQEDIADRLQYFTNLALDSYDGFIIIYEIYHIEYKSYRGKIACPFPHAGMYPKGTISLKNLSNGKEICWTPLNIHMIREHCFFEGKGATHRLEPSEVRKIIFK